MPKWKDTYNGHLFLDEKPNGHSMDGTRVVIRSDPVSLISFFGRTRDLSVFFRSCIYLLRVSLWSDSLTHQK